MPMWGWVLVTALLTGCASWSPAAPDVPMASPPAEPAPSTSAPEAPASPSPVASTEGSQATMGARATAPGRAGLDSLNPDQMIRFDEPEVRRDLWQRIRNGMSLPDLQNDELVTATEQWYAARPDYVQRMTERGSRYLFHIVEEVQRRRLPAELALLPFIESAFNPQALSRAKASGMWQFMPATGRDFDLKQNLFRDDRRDVLASTRAALDYLTRLHAQFGHWHLALAAYNWGEGNVQRAITRNQRAGLPTDYENLRMPDETRRYVPKLLAVKNIVMRPEAYGLRLPPLENHPYFLSVPIERDIDVAVAAKLAGLPEADFAALNPQHNKPVILAAGTPHVLLPFDNAERFLNQIEHHRGPMASWTAWIAPRTLNAADAAKLVGMSEGVLRDINRIPRGMLIRKGSALLVHRHGRQTQDVSEQVADSASLSLQREAVPKPRKSASAASTATPRNKATASAQTARNRASASVRTPVAKSPQNPATSPAKRQQVATHEPPVRR